MKRVLTTALALTLCLACCAYAEAEETKPIWQQGTVFLLQAAGFIITVILLKKWLFVPVSNLFEQRKAEIEDNYLKSEAARDAALQEKQEYESRLAKCDEEINARTAAAATEARRQADSTIEKAKEEAARRKKMAEDEIELEKQKAVREMKEIAVDLGMKAAEKLVRENLSGDANRALCREFIDRLNGEDK